MGFNSEFKGLKSNHLWVLTCKEKELQRVINLLTPYRVKLYGLIPYRAVNTLRLGYTNQSVNAV